MSKLFSLIGLVLVSSLGAACAVEPGAAPGARDCGAERESCEAACPVDAVEGETAGASCRASCRGAVEGCVREGGCVSVSDGKTLCGPLPPPEPVKAAPAPLTCGGYDAACKAAFGEGASVMPWGCPGANREGSVRFDEASGAWCVVPDPAE